MLNRSSGQRYKRSNSSAKVFHILDISIDKKQQMSHQNSKPITSVDEMKNMHNEYNNVYYWSNDFVNQLEAARGEGDEKEKQKGK